MLRLQTAELVRGLAEKQKQAKHPFIQCLFSGDSKYVFKKNSAEKNTIFRLFTLTETVTAIAVMQLVEQNKLKLYDKISGFFPEFTNHVILDSSEKPEKEITVHDLLTHTAGIGHINPGSRLSALYNDSAIFENNQSSNDIVKKIADLPLEFSPGNGWQYSLSYIILGALIENLTNESIDDYFYQYIFAPLEMKDTGFFVPSSEAGRLTEILAEDNSGNTVIYTGPESQRLSENSKPAVRRGDTGLYSTMEDFSRVVQMLQNYGTYKTWRILTKDLIEIMMENKLQPDCPKINPDFPVIAREAADWGYGYGGAVVKSSCSPVFSDSSFVKADTAGSLYWIDHTRKTAGLVLQDFFSKDNDIVRSFTDAVYSRIQ